MKDLFIQDMNFGDDIITFFLIRELKIKKASNGKDYADIVLGDKTGDLVGKIWDYSDKKLDIAKDDIVKVKGSISEWNGNAQLKISLIRKAEDGDTVDLSDFVKTAPEDSEEMYSYLLTTVESMRDIKMKEFMLDVLKEFKTELLYYPAALKNHHSIKSGLIYHIKRMLMLGKEICTVYPNLNPDFVIAGIILHDICKIYELETNEYGLPSGYTFEGQLLGHIIQGIKMIEEKGRQVGLPEEKVIMLEHMVLSHHYEAEYGSPKKPMFPEAEVLHYIDMIDAKMYDMDLILRDTEPGTMSDWVRLLERKLYKPSED